MTRTDGSETGGLSIDEVDRLVARYVWLERRRFEILGSWVTSVPEPEIAALLATQARHHAWHASLWVQHLPLRSGYEPPSEPPAGQALSAFLDTVADIASQPDSVARLVSAFRVLGPQAVVSYSVQLGRTTTVSDAAFARTCRLVLADQTTDGLEGEQALRSLLTTSEERVAVATHYQVELERQLLGAGGIAR